MQAALATRPPPSLPTPGWRHPHRSESRHCRASAAAASNDHHSASCTLLECTRRRQALLAAASALVPSQLVAAPANATQQPCAQHHQLLQAQQQVQQQQQQLSRRTFTLASIQADYDRYAPSYDALDGGAASDALGFPELRQLLLQQARGDVLEVGVGTGLNLPLYRWSSLTSLTGADLSAGMLQQAASRVATRIPGAQLLALQQQGDAGTATAAAAAVQSSSSSSGALPRGPVPVRLVQADVAQLPFPDASFDVVLDTFSLCVFQAPAAALAELARVLRPGGTLLLLEHSRSDNALLGAYQGATRSIVAPLSKGCDYGQDVPALLSALPGLSIACEQRHLAGTLVSIAAVKS